MTLHAEFADHAPFLRALARRLVTDPSVADDLVQETWVAARSGEPGRLRKGPRAWLVGVLRRRAAQRARSESRRGAREQAAARAPVSADTVDVVARLDVARRLLQHVEALDAPQRDVVYLRYYENLEPRQIAARLEVPLSTIKTRLARGLQKLRERLDADHPDGRRHWLPALCAIGGPDPKVGATAVLRAPLLRHLAVAAVVVLTAALAVGAFWTSRDPAPAARRTAAQAGAAARAADDPAARREPVADAAAVTSVAGHVEDAATGTPPGAGLPAANVTVRCRLRTPDAEVEVVTDARGHFEIDVPDGAELVRVEAVGTELLRRGLWLAGRDAPPPERLVITRYPHGHLVGTVSEPSGAAVGGARVLLSHRRDGRRVDVETTADDSGRFVITEAAGGEWLTAEHEGHVQIGASWVTERPRGGFEPARILLAPAATLRVEVVDVAGRPASHVQNVIVALTAAESGLFAATECLPRPPILGRAPPVQGVATLRVPAGLQLALLAGESAFERQQDGVGLVARHDSGVGEPIVVEAGQTRVLRLQPQEFELRGVVLAPDGGPVTDATVFVEGPRGLGLTSLRQLETDARGRFELRLDAAVEQPFALVSAGHSAAWSGLAAQRWLRLDRAVPAEFELRLADEPKFVGRVQDADGGPLEARLQHVVELPGLAGPIVNGSFSTHRDGTFGFGSVVDATAQRLVVSCPGFATASITGLRAGEPIAVTLARPERTRVRFGLDGAPRDLVDLEVLVAYRAAAGGAANARAVLDASTPWLHAAPGNLVDPRSVPSSDGIQRVAEHRRLRPVASPEGRHVELELDRGPAVIVVTGRGPDERLLSWLACDVVTVAGGEIEVPLALTETGSCTGRVVFGDGSERFPACVALADDAGRLLMVSLPMDEGRYRTIVRASSHGHFALRRVPVGACELLIGTREELERGAPRARRRIVIGRGRESIVVKL